MSKRSPTPTDFDDILRDGLSSHKSYVVLKQKHRSPIYLQFKPIVQRLSPTVIYVGGKLSAFPDATSERWQGRHSGERVEDLKTAFRKLPADRVNSARVGTHAGELVVAPTGQRRTFIEKFNSPSFNLVGKLLSAIEEELKIEIENRAQVRKYLILVYGKALGGFFSSPGVKVEARLVGKRSELLVGQSHASGGKALAEFQVAHQLDVAAPPSQEVTEDELEHDAA